MRPVTIWSEGTRIAADLYTPPDFTPEDRRPAIVLCHGWGGEKAHLQQQGARFAAAGYVALAIDYRGWGESDGRVVVLEELPKQRGETTARVRVIREVVDPFDQLWDIRHAIDYLEGEPGVDTARIGLWGSSFGGGLVLWTAAHDERVRCVVSQVGAHDARVLPGLADRTEVRRLATRQARGEIDPVPQDEVPGAQLRGVPHRSKMYDWAPVEYAEQVTVPVMLIDAEHEELFDRQRHSEEVYRRMQAARRAAVRYEVIPGITHYQIYSDRLDEAVSLALQWFDEHLKA